MKAPYKPEPFYCCKHCIDQTYPADDLYWSNVENDWLCEGCFDDYHLPDDGHGIRLDVYLAEQEQAAITSILGRER